MNEAEFDSFAERYKELHAASIHASGEDPDFFAEYKIADVARLARAGRMRDPERILDFGAGVGSSVPHFNSHFPRAEVTCLDVSHKSLELGRAAHGERAQFVHFDGVSAPFPEHSFDLVFAACVFHHIPSVVHLRLLKELHRISRPGGSVIVFEHNPLNPLTVHAVNSCPFDANAVLLRAGNLKRQIAHAGFTHARVRYRIFFPRALRILRPLEDWLTWLPLGAQYFVQAQRACALYQAATSGSRR